MDLAKIYETTVGSSLAREMARIEEERSSWRKALIDTGVIGKQVRELAGNTVYAQMAKELAGTVVQGRRSPKAAVPIATPVAITM
mgnify:CR=1 FL=1